MQDWRDFSVIGPLESLSHCLQQVLTAPNGVLSASANVPTEQAACGRAITHEQAPNWVPSGAVLNCSSHPLCPGGGAATHLCVCVQDVRQDVGADTAWLPPTPYAPREYVLRALTCSPRLAVLVPAPFLSLTHTHAHVTPVAARVAVSAALCAVVEAALDNPETVATDGLALLASQLAPSSGSFTGACWQRSFACVHDDAAGAEASRDAGSGCSRVQGVIKVDIHTQSGGHASTSSGAAPRRTSANVNAHTHTHTHTHDAADDEAPKDDDDGGRTEHDAPDAPRFPDAPSAFPSRWSSSRLCGRSLMLEALQRAGDAGPAGRGAAGLHRAARELAAEHRASCACVAAWYACPRSPWVTLHTRTGHVLVSAEQLRSVRIEALWHDRHDKPCPSLHAMLDARDAVSSSDAAAATSCWLTMLWHPASNLRFSDVAALASRGTQLHVHLQRSISALTPDGATITPHVILAYALSLSDSLPPRHRDHGEHQAPHSSADAPSIAVVSCCLDLLEAAACVEALVGGVEANAARGAAYASKVERTAREAMKSYLAASSVRQAVEGLNEMHEAWPKVLLEASAEEVGQPGLDALMTQSLVDDTRVRTTVALSSSPQHVDREAASSDDQPAAAAQPGSVTLRARLRRRVVSTAGAVRGLVQQAGSSVVSALEAASLAMASTERLMELANDLTRLMTAHDLNRTLDDVFASATALESSWLWPHDAMTRLAHAAGGVLGDLLRSRRLPVDDAAITSLRRAREAQLRAEGGSSEERSRGDSDASADSTATDDVLSWLLRGSGEFTDGVPGGPSDGAQRVYRRALSVAGATMWVAFVAELRQRWSDALDQVLSGIPVADPRPFGPFAIPTSLSLLEQHAHMLRLCAEHAADYENARRTAQAAAVAYRSAQATAQASDGATAASDDVFMDFDDALLAAAGADTHSEQDAAEFADADFEEAAPQGSDPTDASVGASLAAAASRVMLVDARAVPDSVQLDGDALLRTLPGTASADSDDGTPCVIVCPLVEPQLQPSPPMAEDGVFEASRQLRRYGLGQLRSRHRHVLTLPVLRSDMAAFKASNADSSLFDFVTWYCVDAVLVHRCGSEPADVPVLLSIPTTDGRAPAIWSSLQRRLGRLSSALGGGVVVMSASGASNVREIAQRGHVPTPAWRALTALWGATAALPQHAQPPLFNPLVYGESALAALEAAPLTTVLEFIALETLRSKTSALLRFCGHLSSSPCSATASSDTLQQLQHAAMYVANTEVELLMRESNARELAAVASQPVLAEGREQLGATLELLRSVVATTRRAGDEKKDSGAEPSAAQVAADDASPPLSMKSWHGSAGDAGATASVGSTWRQAIETAAAHAQVVTAERARTLGHAVRALRMLSDVGGAMSRAAMALAFVTVAMPGDDAAVATDRCAAFDALCTDATCVAREAVWVHDAGFRAGHAATAASAAYHVPAVQAASECFEVVGGDSVEPTPSLFSWPTRDFALERVEYAALDDVHRATRADPRTYSPRLHVGTANEAAAMRPASVLLSLLRRPSSTASCAVAPVAFQALWKGTAITGGGASDAVSSDGTDSGSDADVAEEQLLPEPAYRYWSICIPATVPRPSAQAASGTAAATPSRFPPGVTIESAPAPSTATGAAGPAVCHYASAFVSGAESASVAYCVFERAP